jgi:hypothetical protein
MVALRACRKLLRWQRYVLAAAAAQATAVSCAGNHNMLLCSAAVCWSFAATWAPCSVANKRCCADPGDTCVYKKNSWSRCEPKTGQTPGEDHAHAPPSTSCMLQDCSRHQTAFILLLQSNPGGAHRRHPWQSTATALSGRTRASPSRYGASTGLDSTWRGQRSMAWPWATLMWWATLQPSCISCGEQHVSCSTRFACMRACEGSCRHA